jgi:hypothetical protein
MTYREAPVMLREIFVKEEKILEEQYPQCLRRLSMFRKDLEHGKVKQISSRRNGQAIKHAEEFQTGWISYTSK